MKHLDDLCCMFFSRVLYSCHHAGLELWHWGSVADGGGVRRVCVAGFRGRWVHRAAGGVFADVQPCLNRAWETDLRSVEWEELPAVWRNSWTCRTRDERRGRVLHTRLTEHVRSSSAASVHHQTNGDTLVHLLLCLMLLQSLFLNAVTCPLWPIFGVFRLCRIRKDIFSRSFCCDSEVWSAFGQKSVVFLFGCCFVKQDSENVLHSWIINKWDAATASSGWAATQASFYKLMICFTHRGQISHWASWGFVTPLR